MKKLLLIIGLLILSCNGKDLTYSQYIISALENVDKGKYQSAFNDFEKAVELTNLPNFELLYPDSRKVDVYKARVQAKKIMNEAFSLQSMVEKESLRKVWPDAFKPLDDYNKILIEDPEDLVIRLKRAETLLPRRIFVRYGGENNDEARSDLSIAISDYSKILELISNNPNRDILTSREDVGGLFFNRALAKEAILISEGQTIVIPLTDEFNRLYQEVAYPEESNFETSALDDFATAMSISNHYLDKFNNSKIKSGINDEFYAEILRKNKFKRIISSANSNEYLYKYGEVVGYSSIDGKRKAIWGNKYLFNLIPEWEGWKESCKCAEIFKSRSLFAINFKFLQTEYTLEDLTSECINKYPGKRREAGEECRWGR